MNTSPVEKSMAKAALYYLTGEKRSEKHDKIAQSCRFVLQDRATPEDLKNIRNFMNVRRSGASAINRVNKGITRGFSRISRITNAAQMSSMATGPYSASANINLFNTVMNEGENLFNNKLVKSVFREAGKFGVGSGMAGIRIFKSISSGLKLGGSLAAMGLTAWQLGENYFKNREDAARSYASTRDAIRNLNINPIIGRQIEANNAARESAHASLLERLFYNSSTQKRIDTKTQDQFKNIAAARNLSSDMGLSTAKILSDYAQNNGKNINNLTEKEKLEAIDNALLKNKTDYSSYLNDQSVINKLNSEFRTGDLLWNAIKSGGFDASGAIAMSYRQNELAQERAKEVVKFYEARQKERETFSAKQLELRNADPVESKQHYIEMKTRESLTRNYKSRHAAKYLD